MKQHFHAAGICDCCDAPTCPGCGELIEACHCPGGRFDMELQDDILESLGEPAE